MKILSHGLPFFCDYATLKQYTGPHEIRSLGAQVGTDYRFRPEVDTLEDVLRRMAPEFVPELILVWTPENDPPPLGIERSPVRTACLAGDWNLFYNAQEYNLGRYDVVLSDKPGVNILTSNYCKPSFFFPLYAQNTLLHKPHQVTRDIDVLYIGNLCLSHRVERGHWLQRLANLSERYNVVLTTNVWGEEYARLHSRAKIVFNHSVRGELNLRVFETMACGSLAFFEDKNPEVSQFFSDGVELVLYNEIDFDEKIDYYLANDAEREAIAERGQKRVQEFAGEARFDALIDYIMARPVSGRPFLRLSEKERAHQDYLMGSVSQRVEYGAIERKLAEMLIERWPEDARSWAARGRSLLYYRDRPLPGVRASDYLDAFKQAIRLDSSSAVHALNCATAARLANHPKIEALFLQLVLRAPDPEPDAYLWGSWVSPQWTRWLREAAEKMTTINTLHAEAHIRLGQLQYAKGDSAAAIEHLIQARTLDPQNNDGTVPLADLLWEAGRKEESVRVMIEDLPHFPLQNPYRLSLATRCIELGYISRADRLLSEAQSIARAVRYPWEPAASPRSHSVRREDASTQLQEEQERRLRERAEATGNFSSLLIFYATVSRADDAMALKPMLASERDLVLLAALFDAEFDTVNIIDAAPGIADAFLIHLLCKRLLKQSRVAAAKELVERGLEILPMELAALNLLIRYLSQAESDDSNSLKQALINRSLAIAPQQEDIAKLRTQPFEGELYLEAAPRLIPVSFYLPAYNVEAYIADTIEHVLLQSYPLHELLVVNDGSADSSIEIARGFPVSILHHDENRGLAAARNTALMEASGEWLASVDTDARPEPEFLLNVILELETRDRGVAATGGMLIEHYQEDVPDRWRAKVMAQHHGERRMQPPPFLFGSTMSVERAAAFKAGGYDELHRTNGEDTELCKSLMRDGRSFLYAPNARAQHMRRDDLHSALRTWWCWYYWVKMEANAYSSVAGLVDALLHSIAQASTRLNQFLAEDYGLVYFSLLFPFYDAFADFNQAVKTGLLDKPEAKRLQELMLERVKALDERYGGALLERLQRDAKPVLEPLKNVAAGELGGGFSEEFNRYLQSLDIVMGSIQHEVYELLVEPQSALSR